MSTPNSIAREALFANNDSLRWAIDEHLAMYAGPDTTARRETALALAAAALAAVIEIDLLEGNLYERKPVLTPSHVYAFHLLAEHPEGLTHSKLFALWQARSARPRSPWPWISESGVRTRVAELKGWGIVEDSGRDGRTPANRPATVWQLAADASWRPPFFAPEAHEALQALQIEAGSNVVTGSLLTRLAAVEVAR